MKLDQEIPRTFVSFPCDLLFAPTLHAVVINMISLGSISGLFIFVTLLLF